MRILIQKHNDRFINNVYDTLIRDGHQVAQSEINRDIYKIYHHYPFELAVLISSKFTHDIAQFVSEFYNGKNKIKFIIYHDFLNEQIINDYGSTAIHLSNTNEKIKNVTNIPKLLNNNIFKNLNMSRKKETYSIFLEYTKVLPTNLEHVLYPATNKQIRLFNSPYIEHHQNIGLISEVEKAEILNSCEFFINTNNGYTDEAIACGAKVVEIDNKGKVKKYMDKDRNIISYEKFIGSIL